MNIFISENSTQDIFDEFSDILDTTKLKKELKEIFKKIYNNYVGYYLFKDNDTVYKIFILPKHICLPQEGDKVQEQDAIKQFLDYLRVYYELKIKYQNDYRDGNKILKSFYEIAFDSQNQKTNAQNIEEFIFSKYLYLLQEIKKFFDTHKANKRVRTTYTSQTIKHRLNLVANIKELDKSKIHQEKYEDIKYSVIATIVYGAIKLFTQQKLDIFDKHEVLRQEATKLTNILLKSYQVDKGFSLSIHKLISTKTYKHFKKKKEYLGLYSNVLALFGIENFFEEDEKELNNDIKRDALFIKPDLMYEWYIYDKIVEKLSPDNYDIRFDKFHGTSKEYFYRDKQGNQRDITSNPDILIYSNNENKVYIIDAKWKTKEPTLEDILKLKRDCEVQFERDSVYAVLVYPKTEENKFSEHLYCNETITFNFSTKEIALDHQDDMDLFEIFLEDVEEALPDQKLDKQIRQIHRLSQNTMQSLQSYGFEDKSFEDSFIMDQTLQHNLVLYDEITKIYTLEEILTDPLCSSLANFLTNHKDILEKECIDFIHSSASSMFYFEKHPNNHYDYSLPASGLWKAIEVELNASIIFLLRYQSGVCTKEYYWKQKGRVNDYIQTGWKKRVFLTDSKKDRNRLDNILLGSFPHIMKNIKQKNYDNDKTLESFQSLYSQYIYHYNTDQSLEKWAEGVTNFLFDLVNVRNPYTHKDLMHKVTYDTYLDYIMNNPLFNFHDLMILKKDICDYIKNQDASND